MQDINHVLVCFLNDKWITILDRKENYTEDVFCFAAVHSPA